MDTPLANFDSLVLPEALKRALVIAKFDTPTPIQAAAIPVALSGRDIIGCAQTGTGKTAAFGIPLVARLLNAAPGTRPRALVLTPTRELAEQVARSIRMLTFGSPDIVTTVLIGGVAMYPQTRSLQKKPQIIVATPGRLMDHLQQGNTNLDDVEVLVLDEADRMLDMGFTPQIDRIVHFLPKKRQGFLFSATLPPDILKVAARYLNNPERVNTGEVSRPAEKVTQKLVRVDSMGKNVALMTELSAREGSVIVFARTKIRTEKVAYFLDNAGVECTLIHGGRSQGQRQRALEGFRQGRFRVLVATDVAARGLDIPHIAHVINYDLPDVPDDYVHRIGRTARAGASGEAVSLVAPDENSLWNQIQRFLDPKGSTVSGGARTHGARDFNKQRPGGFRPHGARPGGFQRTDAPRAEGGAPRFAGPRDGSAQRFNGPREGGAPRFGGNRPDSAPRFGERSPRPEGRFGGGNRDSSPRFGERSPRPEGRFNSNGPRTPSFGSAARIDAAPSRPEGTRFIAGERGRPGLYNNAARPKTDRPQGDRPSFGGGDRPEGGFRSRIKGPISR